MSFPADCDQDSPLILNLSVLLMSFFSCDWILLIFLISRLQAEWYDCRRNNIPADERGRVPPARVLVMKRKYTGIPLRMDGGQPGHANHAI